TNPAGGTNDAATPLNIPVAAAKPVEADVGPGIDRGSGPVMLVVVARGWVPHVGPEPAEAMVFAIEANSCLHSFLYPRVCRTVVVGAHPHFVIGEVGIPVRDAQAGNVQVGAYGIHPHW